MPRRTTETDTASNSDQPVALLRPVTISSGPVIAVFPIWAPVQIPYFVDLSQFARRDHPSQALVERVPNRLVSFPDVGLRNNRGTQGADQLKAREPVAIVVPAHPAESRRTDRSEPPSWRRSHRRTERLDVSRRRCSATNASAADATSVYPTVQRPPPGSSAFARSVQEWTKLLAAPSTATDRRNT